MAISWQSDTGWKRCARRRGTFPKYQSSHLPEKANTGLCKEEVICPTILVCHFPENNSCQSFAQMGSSMDAHCKHREGPQVHSGWWQEGVENGATGTDFDFSFKEKKYLLKEG